jgi:hypothetical protein
MENLLLWRARECVFIREMMLFLVLDSVTSAPQCILQYLIQSCARGGRWTVEDMCYEIRRAEACVD